MDYVLIDLEVFTKPLSDLLVRARKVITDELGWEEIPERLEVIQDIDNELGEVPEAGKGNYNESPFA